MPTLLELIDLQRLSIMKKLNAFTLMPTLHFYISVGNAHPIFPGVSQHDNYLDLLSRKYLEVYLYRF